MNDSLNKLLKLLEEAHTTLGAIACMSEIVIQEDVPAAVSEYVQNIKHACTDLLSAAAGIRDYSKIESGEVNIAFAEYSFAELVDEVSNEVLTQISGRPIRFTINTDCGIPKMLIGDDARLKQAMLSLLDSILDRIKEGSLSMTIESVAEGDTVFLTVKITDSTADMEGDYTIAENLCKIMNGEFSAHYGELTLTVPQKFRSDEKLAAAENAANKRVLVYEPRLIYSNSLSQSLENLGVKYTSVNKQEDFFDELSNSVYTHIFMPVFITDPTKLIINGRGLDTKLILLKEYGEVLDENDMKMLAMPAHSVQIAEILNNDK